MIPFLDLRAAYLELKTEIDAAVTRVLDSGWYIHGPEVEAFEQDFANYCGVEHAVGVANGLDALRLSLLALGVQPGDEIIVPSHTFIATWLAVSQCGATPVPVEPREGSYNIDPAQVEACITSKTRGIIPVHLYGEPADLDPILQIATRHGLFVLEDAAQAHGALYKGRRLGGHSHAVAWSFYPGKNLGAFGDGGAVTTHDASLAQRIRALGNYGSRVKYFNEEQGINSRLDPLQAAALRVKLRHLDKWNERRTIIARTYTQALQQLEIITPQFHPDTSPAWHLYVIQHSQRNQLQRRLTEHGVSSIIHYPVPPHLQNAYSNLSTRLTSLPLAERYANSVLSLPIGPHMTQQQVTQVIDVLRQVI